VVVVVAIIGTVQRMGLHRGLAEPGVVEMVVSEQPPVVLVSMGNLIPVVVVVARDISMGLVAETVVPGL
jgi:hypothetical protein